jgi:rhamnose utilization protein RhaD (predicted bifunctional aldolase and dehydrogenase)/NAD(P)-dependent dehydrogenase (short-subunit alcohol dehydrogenase family)
METLLHAFLPFAHVDHVHADAILALANHSGGREAVHDALGPGYAYLDWERPGFSLATAVANVAGGEGAVLAHHGLITWAEDSDTCLRKTLEAVRLASDFVAAHRRSPRVVPAEPDLGDEETRTLLLNLRAAVSHRARRVLRVEHNLRSLADRTDRDQIVSAGVASADHMLWMRPFAAALDGRDPHEAQAKIANYEQAYSAYFERHRDRLAVDAEMHDPAPRVVLVPGLGAVTTGADHREALRVAEVAARTLGVAADVLDAFGAPQPLDEQATFDFDYWPLELYKLTLRPAPRRFSGTIHVVTGAASGIGRRIALTLAEQGASVVAADLDDTGLATLAEEAENAGWPRPVTVVGDQSDEVVVTETVRQAVRAFGGLDGVVLNAGVGVGGELDGLETGRWQLALSVNLTSAFLLTREAIRVFKQQGLGGSLVYVASKNAFAPGAGFGAYSVTKAGMLQLMRIAALEGGSFGIRANAVNPDAVFDNSRLWAGGLREERAAQHGVRPEELEDFYANRNLLHRRVTTQDVAATVLFLLSEESSRTTGCVIPVDGGVAGGFPR